MAYHPSSSVLRHVFEIGRHWYVGATMGHDCGLLSHDQGLAGETLDSVSVLVADDQAAFRAGVRRTLASHGFRVIAEPTTVAEAVAAALKYRPDICLLAISIRGNGIAAAEEISSSLPDSKIIMMTSSPRDEELLAALRAGADGYLLKSISAERLPLALSGVLNGEAALPRAMTPRLIHEYRNRGRRHRLPLSDVSGEPVELTAREFEVLEALQHGETSPAIAAQLGISEVTVRRHISDTLHKIGVGDRRTALALLARAEQNQANRVATATDSHARGPV